MRTRGGRIIVKVGPLAHDPGPEPSLSGRGEPVDRDGHVSLVRALPAGVGVSRRTLRKVVVTTSRRSRCGAPPPLDLNDHDLSFRVPSQPTISSVTDNRGKTLRRSFCPPGDLWTEETQTRVDPQDVSVPRGGE